MNYLYMYYNVFKNRPMLLVQKLMKWCNEMSNLIFRCSHCKRLKPVWEDLAKEFESNDNIAIANVDCTVDAELCSSQDITGYPT